MAEQDKSAPEEYIEIAEKIRSGEYFRDARMMADFDLHEPMTQRYWYVFVAVISVVITVVTYVALNGFYPLRPRVPYFFINDNIVDYAPRIEKLVNYHGENADVALRRYLVKHYVTLREEYNAITFDRNYNAVRVLSTKDTFDKYDSEVSPLNPNSPVSLYQRNTARKINILSTTVLSEPTNSNEKIKDYRMLVMYEAVLDSEGIQKQATVHKVDVAFKYENIKLDEETGNIKPYGFIVTAYNNSL